MECQEETIILNRLGLTFCQARVYIALVRLGVSAVKAISEASGVRREEVYRLIPKLQELGLVEKIITSPLLFSAIPLQESFSMLQKCKNMETYELNAKIKKALQKFNGNATKLTFQAEYPQFVLVPKKETVMKRRRKLFENAQTSIDSILSLNRFTPWAYTFAIVGKKALERGVKIRLIVEKSENKNKTPKLIQDFQKNPSFKLRYILNPPLAVVTIYDRKEMLVTTSATKDLGESSALWSNNPSLLAIINDFYEILWITAMQKPT